MEDEKLLENQESIPEENLEQKVEETSAVSNDSTVEDKPKKKKKSLAKKIIDIVVYAFFGSLVAVAFAGLISSKMNDGYVFNYMFPVVLTDSMCPDYPVETMLIVKKVKPEEIKIGDDITFKWRINGQMFNMTHRISDIQVDETKELGKGRYKFTAHGINKESKFCGFQKPDGEWIYDDCTWQTQEFNETRVVGKAVGHNKFLGGAYTFFSKPVGLMVIIGIPAMYILISCVLDMFKKAPDEEEKNKPRVRTIENGVLTGLTVEEKEKLKKQMLDELLGKGGKK